MRANESDADEPRADTVSLCVPISSDDWYTPVPSVSFVPFVPFVAFHVFDVSAKKLSVRHRCTMV